MPPPVAPAPIDPRANKAFDFLQDATKQLIALATAILTFTITFLKDLAAEAGADARTLLTGAWIALVVSAVAGLFVLFNMAGVLAKEELNVDIYKGSIRLLSLGQFCAFALALGLILWFGLTWA
jgi:hypothetical protein